MDTKINIINTTPKLSLKKEKSYNIKRIEKLYLDNQRKMDKRTEGILLRDNKISRENTFQPKFVSISVKKLKKNFSLRMYKFNQLKEENKQKLIKSIETENSTIYTFSPKLNNNCSQKNNNKNQNKRIPAYERLYTKNKYLKRKTEEITKDHKSLSMNNKSVDYQKIQKLYEEYKLLKQKRQKDQKILDEAWVSGHIAYGSEQIRQQIQAVYDAGYDEWILWNASNKYGHVKSALTKKKNQNIEEGNQQSDEKEIKEEKNDSIEEIRIDSIH